MRGGALIREARRRAGLSQAALAARVGTTQSAIARLESGATEPTLRRVADAVAACDLELPIGLVPAAEVATLDVALAATGPRSLPAVVAALGAARARFVVAGRCGAWLRGMGDEAGVPLVVPDVSLDGLERMASALDALRARRRTPDATGSLPLDRSPASLRSRARWSLVTAEGDLDLDAAPPGTRGYADLRRDASSVAGVAVASAADLARQLDAAGDDGSLVAALRRAASPPSDRRRR
jgi:transcriptional regulator with XRE-family HTH domain